LNASHAALTSRLANLNTQLTNVNTNITTISALPLVAGATQTNLQPLLQQQTTLNNEISTITLTLTELTNRITEYNALHTSAGYFNITNTLTVPSIDISVAIPRTTPNISLDTIFLA